MKLLQKHLYVLLLLWPCICAILMAAAAAEDTTTTSTDVAKLEGCNNQICGNVEVPYPFGIDSHCAKDKYFKLDCNRTYSPPTLFLGENIQVVNISIEGTMNVVIDNAFSCYNESGLTEDVFDQSISLGSETPYTFSTTENKLVAIGCDTLALMTDAEGNFGSGCFSLCGESVNLTAETACSGLGCCQTSLPKNLKSLNITLGSVYNHSKTWKFNPCDFAFLVDQGTFNVSKMRLDFTPLQEFENSSLLLDWVAENKTCDEAKKNIGSTYACGDNTNCSYSDNAQGYRCHCLKGFRGNPYLRQGCQDIDECEEAYPCEGKCKNKEGDYECKCPLGMHGDGKFGCQGFRITAIATGKARPRHFLYIGKYTYTGDA